MSDTLNEVKKRKDQVDEAFIVTPRERIQGERARSSRFIEEHAKFLQLDDEEILRQILGDLDVSRFFSYILYCQICGQGFAIDERFAFLRFSFCDYDCFSELSIHLNCSKLVERIEHE